MSRLFTSLVLAAVLVWGCSGSRSVPRSQMGMRGGLRSAVLTQAPDYDPEYRLGFGDVIDIKFFQHFEFNETITVRPDGRISLAKVGELRVKGMTPADLDSIITDTYRRFIREPDVTVIVREFGGYKFYVLGEVNRGGGFPVERDMTVLQAIAAAGGPKISAKMGSVMILRRGMRQEVEAVKLNLSKSLKTKSGLRISPHNILVQPRDIIYVPKTAIASASDFMRQVYTGILPPLDLYLRAVIIYGNL